MRKRSTIILGLITFCCFLQIKRAEAQQFQTQPLYRYQSARGHYLYTTDATLPKGLTDGPWENEGIVCYVPKPAPHGTLAVFQLAKTDDLGVRYAFTANAGEANSGGGWTNQGKVFFVASAKLPGTVPFYRLYKPLIPGKQKDTSVLGKFKSLIAGPEFTESTANVLQDTTFYTADEGDKALALNHGFVSQGILGYVWPTPVPASQPTNPDLIVQKVSATETSVTAVLRNQGKANTGGVQYVVSLSVYDRNNNLLFRLNQAAPGLSPNQMSQVTFNTGDKSLKGKRYQVVVDSSKVIAETDEGNNETAILDGPANVKIRPVEGEVTSFSIPLSMRAREETKIKIGQREVTRIEYFLKVSNPNIFPSDWFQPLPVLPITTCDGKPTNARLLMEVSWKLDKDGKFDKAGVWLRGNCTPLMSPQSLAEPKFAMNDDRAIPDHIRILVRDRLTGITHESNSITVGAFGVGDAIHSLGCTSLLGRENDFVCRKQVGFEACENLRKNGKPIKCTLVKEQ